ncbi:hypothetical protein Back11_41800 [Paenibacillus baekrokdamisoli]|uniref:Pyrrolo-quinoline quinone repeat domain-containing protein n=1 Tax=Paenibacillus baekrokdamisoli TaxID=1712516 RepID=A0A3G9J3A5_9BACL|nr:PQQ-binding-like beta-propeller repeat protein [Paenibacillus baekrokdamisoli]MBB3068121.1 outer membrane protein assembly factor BamB [Paenibacillus baekrokdamisoli]BBH22835.1 hypothetical protein Back11_41800 [Paenibacillus baekrokdamisoli]
MRELRRIVMKRGARAAAALLTVSALLLSGTAVYAGIDPHTSYVGANFDTSTVVPTVKVQWSVIADKLPDDFRMNEGYVAASSSTLFVIQSGKLLAIQARTGKKLWSFGTHLKAPLLYEDGRIVVNSDSGNLYGVDAIKGKKLWTTSVPSKEATKLFADKGQLYVMNGDIQAYRISDGKFLWKDNYSEQLPSDQLLVQGNRLLIENTESGAYMYSVLHAFDSSTGKEAWRLNNETFPIDARGNNVISSRAQTMFDHVMLTTLDTIDVQTGKVVKTQVYNPQNIDVAKKDFYGPGHTWIIGDKVFIAYQSSVYSYPLNQDPSTVKREAYKLTGISDQATLAAGPYDGRLIFAYSGQVYGVKMVNNSPISYNAGMSNPVARFDIIGQGIYVALTDGKLIATDLTTAKPVLQLQTYARVFGKTIAVDGMIIVQTKGKMLAFPEPKQLKVKA